ncbi:MAG: alpha/beta family hydrolase [Actinomycetota bacterium]
MSPAGVVLFPGAGTSADHSSLVALERALAPLPVARIDFHYRRAGKRAPDRAPVLIECVRTEVRAFADRLGVSTADLVIGGRSMGGRMCSMAVADADAPLAVRGLVCIAYPLAPPRTPDKPRIEHLPRITVPTLCVSGTKDEFGSPGALESAFAVVPGQVQFSWLEGKRHDLARCDDEVASRVARWINGLADPRR